ncbi:MAG: secondary thiamine-phosphate synthase enzyme YjbQ [Desulfurococcaceae archaeon]|nr:secondary thiamine-phosphate synthase enzyme YjbQ [Desulfurococcaceae archaeon]MCC6060305.1 secondary thiamine-phosphate synthase enzyme YjbQ [Desulfurococcaceae archaeon]
MRVVQGMLEARSRSRFDIVDVTGEVEKWLAQIKAGNGVLVVYTPHTTAALAINEREEGLLDDIVELLKELTKPERRWKHNLVDDNAHAHLGNVIVGGDKVIPVSDGRLALGTWQRLLLLELDGPRVRRINLVYVGE